MDFFAIIHTVVTVFSFSSSLFSSSSSSSSSTNATSNDAAQVPNWLSSMAGAAWKEQIRVALFRRHRNTNDNDASDAKAKNDSKTKTDVEPDRWRYVIEDPIVEMEDILALLTEEQLNERITEISLYSSLTISNLDGLVGHTIAAIINAFSHHEFLVLTTSSGGAVSIEKLEDGLILQFSDSPEKLVQWQIDFRRRCVRLIDAGQPDSGPKVTSVRAFVKFVFASGEPRRVYHVVNENCTDFSVRLLEALGARRLYPKFEDMIGDLTFTCGEGGSFAG